MPDESCRICGGLLLDYAVCGICKESIQNICRICARKTMQKFHEGYCFEYAVPKRTESLILAS